MPKRERQQMTFLTIGGGTGAYDRPRAAPLAAAADPGTSHGAAARVKAKADDQAARVAALVAAHPGCTSLELANRSTDAELDRFTIARRLSVAEGKGLVRRGDARECRQSGHKALTWWPVERGEG